MTSKHLLNAETQIAAELKLLVERFISAKKNRLALANKILVKSEELAKASELIHSDEVQPTPIPPLASVHARQTQPAVPQANPSTNV